MLHQNLICRLKKGNFRHTTISRIERYLVRPCAVPLTIYQTPDRALAGLANSSSNFVKVVEDVSAAELASVNVGMGVRD